MRTGWSLVWCFFLVAACNRAAAPPLQPVSAEPRPFDWPQWRGPARSGVSRETGLLQSWPANGPPLAWKVTNLGGGYSAPAIYAGRVFGLSFVDGDEVVWALDETNGRKLWQTRVGTAKPSPAPQGSEGPHGTPAVDRDWLYVEGLNGDVACLSTADGSVRWHKDLVADFGGKVPTWGYSESLLIDGDKVICTPGGAEATMVALDKRSGEPNWRARIPPGEPAAYSSPIAIETAGVRQYVQFLAGGVVGVAAEDGRFLWRYNHPANNVANCSTPVFADGLVFAASNYSTGGGLAEIVGKNGRMEAREVRFTKHMKNHHGGYVLLGGCLYGSDDPGSLACLDFKTLNVRWEERKAGKGSIAAADGRLYYRDESGPMVLVEAKPERYIERGRFDPPERSSKSAWSNPVIANGRLYLRDQGALLCYDVTQH